MKRMFGGILHGTDYHIGATNQEGSISVFTYLSQYPRQASNTTCPNQTFGFLPKM